MSSDITLSAAVRSNLLSLQNTASLLDTTQTRLATGNKVNSALDNPTSYFTAQSLNARASDLGNLLDSVSNAIQTIQAANDGITSITKLVESAQATANQAQQLSETVAQTSGAVAEDDAEVATSNTTSLTIHATVAEQDVSSVSSNLTSVVITDGDAGTPAVTATATGVAVVDDSVDAGANGFTKGTSLTLSDGTNTYTIDFYDSTDGAYGGANTGIDVATGQSIADVAGAIQTAIQGNSDAFDDATVDASSGNLVITLGTDTDASLTIGGTAATALGFSATPYDPTAEVPATPANSGDIVINNTTISLSDGDDFTAILNALQTAATNSTGADAFTVDNASGVLTIKGANGNDLDISGDAQTLSALGITAADQDGTNPVAGNTGDVTINGQTITLEDGDDSAAILTKLQDAASAATGTNAFTVSNASGTFTIKGTDGNDVAISGDAPALAALGLTGGTTDGTPASAGTTSQVANPARGALIAQYNGLLDQINQLTADAGYNGNNLLAGATTTLKVLFNESGTSSLTITGKDASASGLGLTQLVSTDFDTNTSITAILAKLKTATDTLRSDASSFGSNLSIVQTRQDFTKAIINTLQTGASNLTLADSNEEAANLLALQTRQSLSTKALSLASQSDQNVLRLLQ